MMRILLYTTLVLISTLESFAQSDSIVIQKYSQSGKVLLEECFISIDSIRNGPYKKFNEKGKKLMEGQYVDGILSGIWTYYEDNNWNRVYSKFDWSTKTELEYRYYSNRHGTNASDSFCRFPGGEVVYQHFLIEYIDKIALKHSKLKGKAKIKFKIDPTGKATLEEIKWFDLEGNKQAINSNLELDLNALIDNMPIWINCSVLDNNKFAYILPVMFK